MVGLVRVELGLSFSLYFSDWFPANYTLPFFLSLHISLFPAIFTEPFSQFSALGGASSSSAHPGNRMNLCAIRQKAFSSTEETKRSVWRHVSDGRDDDVFCPKPRRFNILTPSMNEQRCGHLGRNLGHHTDSELRDSMTGIDLLDILLLKGGCVGEQSFALVDASPLSMCGSPPSRVANPLIRDVQFGVALSPNQSLTSSPGRNGNNPGVRVEGFDCLERERGNCSILTFV